MKKQLTEANLHQFAPRREPRQKRSRILFDRIVVTAKTLFERNGYAFVTTNMIANEANISIGSLYQYFKNCESIALAVYEDACAKAALTMKRRTIEILNYPVGTSASKDIERLFDIFEKDRYALLQLINEVPELRRISQPLSFDSLNFHTTRMFLEQVFTDADKETIARKAYIINKCVLGTISRYLDDRTDSITRDEVIAELTHLVQQYTNTLSRRRVPSTRSRRGRGLVLKATRTA
jgi:AcrR family transcriptional regulator